MSDETRDEDMPRGTLRVCASLRVPHPTETIYAMLHHALLAREVTVFTAREITHESAVRVVERLRAMNPGVTINGWWQGENAL